MAGATAIGAAVARHSVASRSSALPARPGARGNRRSRARSAPTSAQRASSMWPMAASAAAIPQIGAHRCARTPPGRSWRSRIPARPRSSRPAPRRRARAAAAPGPGSCRRRCRRSRREGCACLAWSIAVSAGDYLTGACRPRKPGAHPDAENARFAAAFVPCPRVPRGLLRLTAASLRTERDDHPALAGRASGRARSCSSAARTRSRTPSSWRAARVRHPRAARRWSWPARCSASSARCASC